MPQGFACRPSCVHVTTSHEPYAGWRKIAISLIDQRSQFSGVLVLQIMYRLCQFSERMGPNGVLPVLEVSDCRKDFLVLPTILLPHAALIDRCDPGVPPLVELFVFFSPQHKLLPPICCSDLAHDRFLIAMHSPDRVLE